MHGCSLPNFYGDFGRAPSEYPFAASSFCFERPRISRRRIPSRDKSHWRRVDSLRVKIPIFSNLSIKDPIIYPTQTRQKPRHWKQGTSSSCSDGLILRSVHCLSVYHFRLGFPSSRWHCKCWFGDEEDKPDMSLIK